MAKQFYPITLWTDEVGANELGDLVNEVKFLKIKEPNYLWCEPKFEAMIEESAEESIFIDGDVFLSEPIQFKTNADVWFEHYEIKTFDFGYNPQINAFDNIEIYSYFKDWNPNLNGAYNVGILRFRNNQIMNEYRNTFYQLKKYYFDEVIKRIKLPIPEMVMEEYSLHCLSKAKNWKVEELRSFNEYFHLYGQEKYQNGFLHLFTK